MEPYKIEVLNKETNEFEEGIPQEGDTIKEYFETGKYDDGTPYGYTIERDLITPPLEETERLWRNEELAMTDMYLSIPDYPNRENYIVYRKQLRDWPETDDFPSKRPELDITMVAYTHREFYSLIGDDVLIELLLAQKNDVVLEAIKQKFDNADMIYSNDPDLENALIYMLNHQGIPSMTQEKIDKILK